MTDQTPSLWSFGTTKTFQIPIEHLDFKYVENCSDIKHLEKILVVLRSGEEGFYPELIECCEKRIQTLCPESRILRKEKPAATASSFTREEWEKIDGDIKSWVSEIKKEDSKMYFHEIDTFQESEGHLPPVRGTNGSFNTGKEKDNNKSKSSQKKKVPRDYAEWDKFDVEKECSKIDEDYKENTTPNICSHSLKIEKKIDTIGLSDKEKDFLATREKEKGNEAFSSGDYEEAVTYYTRSLSVSPTVAAYNNRAQAEIKLKNWNNALQDCEKVLELEPGNLKAFMRRATAYKHQNKYHEAIEDLKKVLNIEPDNVIAKKILSEVEKDLNKSQLESAPKTKGKRMVIQEIEDSEDEDGKRSGEHENGSGDKKTDVSVGGEPRSDRTEMGNVQHKFTGKGNGKKSRGKDAQKCRERTLSGGASDGQSLKPSPEPGGEVNGHLGRDQPAGGSAGAKEVSGPGSAPSLLPGPAATAADLKSRGNELFKNGQFGEAVLKYSQAVEKLQASGSENADELSVLYSNRAACYLKEGNCSGCIEDCNRALELQPFSIKPLLRRAVAYETMEQYRKAYVDYKTVLQIDNRIQAANDSINRITRTLIDQDGPAWREKLPPIPAVPFSVQLHRLDGGGSAAQTTQNGTTESGHRQESSVPGEKRGEMFAALKEEGNEFVKKGKYKEAVDKYSECLEINHSECVIYTNRALCYLKLCQFEEAKQDCDGALEIEEANVKALYRRGLAHKGLKNYQESFNDFSRVLLIDPNVSEAKKELTEITMFLNNKDDTTLHSQEKERRKIKIEEVVESSEEQPEGSSPENVSIMCHDLEKEPASSRPLAMDLEKLHISKPANAYEFGQILNAINTRKDEEACAKLLAITDPQDLPAMLSNKLEGDTFLLLIQSLKNHLLDNDPALVYQHLLYLSKAERFMMMLTLLSKEQKEQTEQLLEALSDKSNYSFTSEDIESLKKQYEL